MNRSPSDLFAHAMDATRDPETAGEAPATGWSGLARRVIAARRRATGTDPCPTAFLRRAQAVFAGRPLPAPVALARLVLDSWSELAPAVRGRRTTRMLRYAAEGHFMDVQLDRVGAGPLVVHVATDRPGPEATCVLSGMPEGDLLIELDEHGVGRVDLVADEQAFELQLRELGRTAFRTPAISWRS